MRRDRWDERTDAGLEFVRRLSVGSDSIRPCEPDQYLLTSCSRGAGGAELAVGERLVPGICMIRLCSMSKCAGVIEFGEDTKMNLARRRMSPGNRST